ncbi:MAG: endolytic transglycosylase MltG [bacterium]|nr:MAG: endolytic transglycosylase MltG [bacterium]
MEIITKTVIALITTAVIILGLVWSFFGPANNQKQEIVLIIPQDTGKFKVTEELFNQGLIKNKKGFEFLANRYLKGQDIKSGGYKLNSSLNAWQTINKLKGKQDLMWVNIYFCPRKEQVGEKLAEVLGWDENKLEDWNDLYKDTDYYEGVYYPDTYLIPVDESVEDVSQRFINRFNDKFAPLADEYTSKNIKWTTSLKIASLIAREAAGREDMNLISGIIWNRLDQGMRLQIDATMQYTLGKNEKGSWWGAISLKEKQSDSPYNSYKNKGLPPTPICSPNIEFISAVINPEETECLFYLHDKNKKIYCSKTYEEHKENINNYLR